MKALIWLALRSLRHTPWRNGLLMLCLSAVIFIPWASTRWLRHYDRTLNARAAATPLVIGQRGSRFDLCLGALFFRKATLAPLPWSAYKNLLDRGDVLPVPVHLGFTVQDLPLVCTTPEYLEQRGLACSNGHVPYAIRQVTLGSQAAKELGAGLGDLLYSDPAAGFGISGAPAQGLQVVGILRSTGGPDDRAVFASLQTAWLLQGDLHGHAAAAELQAEEPGMVLAQKADGVILSGAVVPDQQDQPDHPVHLHVEADSLPISAILLWPESIKSRTLLQTEVETEGALTILRPTVVVQDLLRTTLRYKTLIDRLVGFLGLGMLALLALVLGLSYQMRSKEWSTLRRLGTPPHTIAALLWLEIGSIASAALGLAAIGTWCAVQWLPGLVRML